MVDFEMQGSVLRKYRGEGGAVVVPDGITEIYICAFCGREDVTSITFPSSLIKIGERAFKDCTGLTSLDFPNSLHEIGREAFAGCTGLSSVFIPASVTELDFYAFHDCHALKHIEAPAGVLNDWPFPRKAVESAVIHSGSSLSKNAFEDFTNLSSVEFADTVEYIEQGAFKGCTALKELRLPDSLKRICEGAFGGCAALAELSLGSSLYRVDKGAFSGCTALSSLSFPASTVRIEPSAFDGCESLGSCSFADTDRWCIASPYGFWAPYDDVKGEDVDLSDPEANVATLKSLTDSPLFKKRAEKRPEPAKPRFLTPARSRTEGGLFVQGRYFAPLLPDEKTEAALWEEANEFAVVRTEVTEHDHDEYGRYTDVETKYTPLTSYRGLTAPSNSQNADFIVVDGKLVGIILCRVFYGSCNAYDDWFITLPETPEDKGSHLILLWADGQVVGDNTTTYSDHSGRDFTDSSIKYSLTRSSKDGKEYHANWN